MAEEIDLEKFSFSKLHLHTLRFSRVRRVNKMSMVRVAVRVSLRFRVTLVLVMGWG